MRPGLCAGLAILVGLIPAGAGADTVTDTLIVVTDTYIWDGDSTFAGDADDATNIIVGETSGKNRGLLKFNKDDIRTGRPVLAAHTEGVVAAKSPNANISRRYGVYFVKDFDDGATWTRRTESGGDTTWWSLAGADSGWINWSSTGAYSDSAAALSDAHDRALRPVGVMSPPNASGNLVPGTILRWPVTMELIRYQTGTRTAPLCFGLFSFDEDVSSTAFGLAALENATFDPFTLIVTYGDSIGAGGSAETVATRRYGRRIDPGIKHDDQ